MGTDLIFYQFSRSRVERGDFSNFLTLYGPENLPTGRRLRELMGSIVFCVEGYDDDPREIHSIPEVRRFYAAFHEAWPYWLYFCTLHEDSLKVMTLCCLQSFTALKVDGQSQCSVQFDPRELIQFISRDFAPMNRLCDRAQMHEHLVNERTDAIFAYFGLLPDQPRDQAGHPG